MPFQRSLVPITRSSRYALIHNRSGGASAYRVFTNQSGHQRGRPGVGLVVASALGLSLVTYYSLVVNPVHADRPHEHDLEKDHHAHRRNTVHALRASKSVDSFSSAASRHDTEELLKRYEETHRPPSISGIARYDITQVASNNPLEDDHSEAIITSEGSLWSFFAVLDGHSGWETSALLREELIASVTSEFVGISSQNDSPADPFADAIVRGFKKLDDKIVHNAVEQVFQGSSRNAGMNLLAPAYAGACALLAFYDAKSSILRVALTGDCRAVLGRRRPDGKFDLEVLTTDQTGFDPDEKKRVEAEHPGEEVVKNGRTMGFGPSRVFGDARYKWSREVQERLKKSYLGRTVLDSIKTPPYFTAEPVVTTTNVKPGDFLILATDGLWECLTSREAIGLVGQWVQQTEGRKTSWWNQWWNRPPDDLPVAGGDVSTKAVEVPTRYGQWGVEKKFVIVDANAATHLVRNALGGADEDLREALLSMRSPRARTYWDDITATVVFFG